MGSLLPDVGTSSESQVPIIGPKPKFAQLYVYDTEHEVQNRMGIFNDLALNTEIVHGLMKMFDEHNSLVKVFRSARDRFTESEVVDLRIRLIGTRNRDVRQYNLPSSNEIDALIIGNGGEPVDHRDVIVEKRTSGLQRITELHPSYIAKQYPILFPYGEDGYETKILHNGLVVARGTGQSTVSIREYYAFRVQQRENEGRTLIMVGRLFQQFLVDAYISIEEERLRWVWNNQKMIRSNLYQGLRDAVIRDDNAANVVGKRVVLPATFTGGPRYMVQSLRCTGYLSLGWTT